MNAFFEAFGNILNFWPPRRERRMPDQALLNNLSGILRIMDRGAMWSCSLPAPPNPSIKPKSAKNICTPTEEEIKEYGAGMVELAIREKLRR